MGSRSLSYLTKSLSDEHWECLVARGIFAQIFSSDCGIGSDGALVGARGSIDGHEKMRFVRWSGQPHEPNLGSEKIRFELRLKAGSDQNLGGRVNIGTLQSRMAKDGESCPGGLIGSSRSLVRGAEVDEP